MNIKTLAEILAEEGIQTEVSDDNTNFEHNTFHAKTKVSNSCFDQKIDKKKAFGESSEQSIDNNQSKQKTIVQRLDSESNLQSKQDIERKTNINKIDNPKTKTESGIDNISDGLIKQLKTPEQYQSEIEEIKSESRLRWLAFYYLSLREHSENELRQKLLSKKQDPQKIESLLLEFSEKGYQSDYRTTFVLIREGIRKGRGRNRIKQDLLKRQINIHENIDELIDLANEESGEFYDLSNKNNQIDWLKNAVEVRVRKYGDEIPKDKKDKARQLRFLQYRGYESEICFEALKYNLNTLEDKV